MGAVDFHTHAFPDALAERAVRFLEAEGGIEARIPGTVSALIESMDRSGVDRSVVASIATRPSQFDPILKWSQSIASSRILPFPSIHPGDPKAVEKVRLVAAEGFRGVKLHPYYQDFVVDEQRMFPIYRALSETGLVLLLHAGFDMAYERVKIANAARIARVSDLFPGLKMVASHMGAWKDWDEVRARLLGRPVYLDVSYAIEFMTVEEARGMIQAHGRDWILFGTDSPWAGQAEMIRCVRSLGLGVDWEEAILWSNANRLLGLGG